MSLSRSTAASADSSLIRRAALAALTLAMSSPGCSDPIFDSTRNGTPPLDPTPDASTLLGEGADDADRGGTGPSDAGPRGGTNGTLDGASVVGPSSSTDDAGRATGGPGGRIPGPGPGSLEGDAGSQQALPAAQPLSERAEQLLGSYVARSYGFWTDDSGAEMLVDELGLAVFERDGDRVIMRMRVCRQSTRSSGISVDLGTYAGFPELHRTVSFDADGWRTDSEPLATGFKREGVTICDGKPGQNVPRLPVHEWLTTATCRCPASSAEPPSPSDCRLTDDDDDGLRAVTYLAPVLGWTLTMATVIRSHHVHGRAIDAGDQFANVKLDEVGYQLSCTDRARGECPDADRFGRPCTSEHNGTHFVSLKKRNSPSLSCDAAIARESEFFPTPIPARPRACVRDVLTDDPMRP